ncbi:hypothetical protein LBW78_05240 [Rothia kristinae]|uniref:hypothetical protein n=1 Tax=Rothia kristinae TaxID=37923 RepID=UPI000772DD95|nr:hypothetical protein [Rothia kristinae]MCA1169795.1 hypothetical protein [Rothia kristinae]MED6046741.1 hypothetical protein [Rothia kristinae]SIL93983.1 Uncharacterised protein [Mycobacteroides abscessus subsp. abscessus]
MPSSAADAQTLHTRFEEQLALPSPDPDAAERLLDEARTQLGERDPFTVQVASYRATALAAGGQVDRALELFDELIRQTSAASDESSAAQRSFLLQQKAAVLESAERADEAISALQETVASWAAAGARFSEQLAEAQLHLSRVQLRAGRTGDAAEGLTRLLGEADQVLGPDHALTFEALRLRVVVLFAAGRFDAGAKALRRLLVRVHHYYGADSAQAAALRRSFGQELAYAYDPAASRSALESLVADTEQRRGEQDPQTLQLRRQLAGLLERLGLVAEAEEQLHRGWEDLDELQRTALTHAHLMIRDQHDAARTEYRKLLEMVVADPTEEHRELLTEAALARGLPEQVEAEQDPRGRVSRAHRDAHDRLIEALDAYREAEILGDEEEIALGLFAADELRYAGALEASVQELEALRERAETTLGAEHPRTEEVAQTLDAARAGIRL